jgi:apolipoprotein N-acyltransferase
MRNDGKAEPVRQPLFRPGPLAIAFALGAVTIAGYAPCELFVLPVLTLAALFVLWQRAGSARAAAAMGFAFGLGLFLFGVSWVYVSLHDFGAMPAPVAVVVTALFCAFLALFPAAVAALCVRPAIPVIFRCTLLAPAIWTLAEWIRSWIFTGFPWLALGYSQVPSSFLAGYAPVLGLPGVTLATAASAGLLAGAWLAMAPMANGGWRMADGGRLVRAFALHPASIILLGVWLGGFALRQAEWTRPVGAPLQASLLQGAVPQDLKWRDDRVLATLEIYRSLAIKSASPLIILPETALPLFLDQVPRAYLDELAGHARDNGGDILIGVPERLSGGDYFNSVISLGSSRSQTYRKSHLVPFGEFVPLRPVLGWLVGMLAIPLQDFSRGDAGQRPLAVAGQRVAINVCYEDAFGEEIIRQLPEATLLVNVSNVAWFGRSIAPAQHRQISQARALETGRMLLRATNTGVTAVIGFDGRVLAEAPQFALTALTHTVQGRAGATPYVRAGNGPALAACVALLIVVAGWSARRRPHSASG